MNKLTEHSPDAEAIIAAHERIEGLVERTPVLSSDAFNELLDCQAYFKCEQMQPTGAFKLRGATNAIRRLREQG